MIEDEISINKKYKTVKDLCRTLFCHDRDSLSLTLSP